MSLSDQIRDAELRDAWHGRGRDRLTHQAAIGNRVADVMVRFPKTHDPGSRLEEIRAFFEDDHVHMALIVALDGRLVTTIERRDLPAAIPGSTLARGLGALTGRTAGPADTLDAATAALLRGRRRRLAVVNDSGQLLGLLCLKKDEAGYCSDEGIRERAREARRSRHECF
jgi:CBS domain-containing protein